MEKQAVVKTLPEALKMIKEMNLASPDEWTGDYRENARETIGKVLKERMEPRSLSRRMRACMPRTRGLRTCAAG